MRPGPTRSLPPRLRLLLGILALLAVAWSLVGERRADTTFDKGLQDRRRLAVVAGGRRSRAQSYLKEWQAFLDRAGQKQARLIAQEASSPAPPSRPRQGVANPGRPLPRNRWSPPTSDEIRKEIAQDFARARWSRAMAEQLSWAADRPARPLPVPPPHPDQVVATGMSRPSPRLTDWPPAPPPDVKKSD